MKKHRFVGAMAGGRDLDTIMAFLPPASPVDEKIIGHAMPKSLVTQCQNHWSRNAKIIGHAMPKSLVNVALAGHGHWLVNDFGIGWSMVFHWLVNDGRGGR